MLRITIINTEHNHIALIQPQELLQLDQNPHRLCKRKRHSPPLELRLNLFRLLVREYRGVRQIEYLVVFAVVRLYLAEKGGRVGDWLEVDDADAWEEVLGFVLGHGVAC